MNKKITPIRLDEKTRKEHAKLLKNAKAKVRNIKKRYGLSLDDVVETKPIESFKTRDEYNEWRSKAQSFTNRANLNYQYRKNQFGLVLSKKEINQHVRNTKDAQRIAEKLQSEAVNKPFVSGGKEQGTQGQRMLQMGKPETAGIVRPNDFNFDKIRTKQQFKKKKQNMEERSKKDFFDTRMEKMKENFMWILLMNFNDDAEELVQKINNIPARDFYEMYLQFDEFDFNKYDSLNEGGYADNGQLEKMMGYVDDYNDNRLNMDLKNI